jgi:anti-sigma-K factor RskA
MSTVDVARAVDHTEDHEELAALASIGALDGLDAQRYALHRRDCDYCRQLEADYAATTMTLADTLEPMQPSPGARDAMLDALGPMSRPTPITAARRWRPPTWSLSLAAVLAVVIGFGYWASELQSQINRLDAQVRTRQEILDSLAAGAQQWQLTGTSSAPAASGFVYDDPQTGKAVLVLVGLEALPPDQQYQVWVIKGGTPTDVGLMSVQSGPRHLVRLNRAVGDNEIVAVTIEPRGGSRGPTGPIVVSGKI